MIFYHRKRGQVLLYVIVAMTIALALGLSIAVRTVSTTSQIARTDNYSRLRTATEAALEKYLSMPVSELRTLSQNGLDPNVEELYEGNAADPLDIRVQVWVELTNKNYETGVAGHNNGLFYKVEKGSTVQYNISNLAGRRIWICWLPDTSTPRTAVHLTFYNTDSPASVVSRVGLKNSFVSGFSEFVYVSDRATLSPLYCTDNVVVPASAEIVRMTSLWSTINLGIAEDSLNDQAFKIRAKGELLENATVKEVHEAAVYKSFPFISLPFDFAVYSESQGWN